MPRSIALLLLFLALVFAVSRPAARAEEVSAADREAIAAVIQSQIAAFHADDAAGAFAHASPAIRAKFGTPERFIEMVRTGYFPVYRARDLDFGEITIERGAPVQEVMIRAPDGSGLIALYYMERQRDGSWKINGVVLTKSPERVV